MCHLAIIMALFVSDSDTARVQRPARSLKAQIQGEWRLQGLQIDGCGLMWARGITCVIDDKSITWSSDGKLAKHHFSIDTRRTQTRIEIRPADGPRRIGICKITCDLLHICLGVGSRPTEFFTRPGSEHELIILARIEPESETQARTAK